jgi:hypothetical protein
MWIASERNPPAYSSRRQTGGCGDAEASLALFASKADVAATVTYVTQAALELGGGRGYAETAELHAGGATHRRRRSCPRHAPAQGLARPITARPPAAMTSVAIVGEDSLRSAAIGSADPLERAAGIARHEGHEVQLWENCPPISATAEGRPKLS